MEGVDVPAAFEIKMGPLSRAVRDQGFCGSCWAAAATAVLEGHMEQDEKIMASLKAVGGANGSTSLAQFGYGEGATSLSAQAMVSCTKNPRNCGGTGGCGGATQPLAFNYTKVAGITSETDYPYRGMTGTCNKGDVKPVAKNDGYVKLKVNDYNTLMNAVAEGPVAISLAAGGMGWQIYGGGVFGGGLLGKCGYDQDHGVQLVGYGASGSNMYWIVRNSWGPGWGEKGFMRIKRYGDGKEPCGTDSRPQDGDACTGDKKPRTYCGECGILSSSSYPTGLKKAGAEIVV